jgi:hypothetical protein
VEEDLLDVSRMPSHLPSLARVVLVFLVSDYDRQRHSISLMLLRLHQAFARPPISARIPYGLILAVRAVRSTTAKVHRSTVEAVPVEAPELLVRRLADMLREVRTTVYLVSPTLRSELVPFGFPSTPSWFTSLLPKQYLLNPF